MRYIICRFEHDRWIVWDGQWQGQTDGAGQYEMEVRQFQRFLASNLIFGVRAVSGRYLGQGWETVRGEGQEFVGPRNAIPYPRLTSGLVSSVILLERVLPKRENEWPRWRVIPVLSGANVGMNFFRPIGG